MAATALRTQSLVLERRFLSVTTTQTKFHTQGGRTSSPSTRQAPTRRISHQSPGRESCACHRTRVTRIARPTASRRALNVAQSTIIGKNRAEGTSNLKIKALIRRISSKVSGKLMKTSTKSSRRRKRSSDSRWLSRALAR